MNQKWGTTVQQASRKQQKIKSSRSGPTRSILHISILLVILLAGLTHAQDDEVKNLTEYD